MSAFERIIKKHLVSYRNKLGHFMHEEKFFVKSATILFENNYSYQYRTLAVMVCCLQ